MFMRLGPPKTDQELRVDFDLICRELAQFEDVYQETGLKFFSLPVSDGLRSLEEFQRFFCPTEGQTFRRELFSIRSLLEQIKTHINCLRFQHIHDAEFAAAVEKLTSACKAHHTISHRIAVLTFPYRSYTAVAGDRVNFNIFDGDPSPPSQSLPTSEADERYADFRRWALTVRAVQNLVALGEDEETAIASLSIEGMRNEERMVSAGFLSNFQDTEGDDDVLSESEDGSSVSNPYEDPDHDSFDYSSDFDEPLRGIPLLRMLPPAIEFR